MRSALADTPPERVGGAILITDGVVHDIPADAAALGFHAPLHALITGHEGERDRRLELVEAPRYGIVGKNQTIGVRVLDSDDHGEPATVTVKRDGKALATLRRRASASGSTSPRRSTTPATTSSSSKSRRCRAN